MNLNSIFIAALLVTLGLAFSTGYANTTARVTWDPNPTDQNVVDYRLEMRTSNVVYESSVRLQSKKDSKCVTLGLGVINMQECDTARNSQVFFVQRQSTGQVSYRSLSRGACLAVSGGQSGNGIPIVTEPCDGSRSQRYDLREVDGAMRIDTQHGVLDAHAQNGSLIQWAWGNYENQKWYYRDYVQPNDWLFVEQVPDSARLDGKVHADIYVGVIEPGTELCFRVQALRGSDSSDWSDSGCITVPADDNTNTVDPTVSLTAPVNLEVRYLDE